MRTNVPNFNIFNIKLINSNGFISKLVIGVFFVTNG